MAETPKKDLEEISNEQLNMMFTPLSYRETDPMERYRQVGNVIVVVFLVLLFLYLIVFR